MKVNYANWIPKTFIFISYMAGFLCLLGLPVFSGLAFWAVLIFGVGVILYGSYMWRCYNLFSFNKKSKLTLKIYEYLLGYLDFEKGRILDVGCGNGALAILIAKRYPEAYVTGIDYFGKNWPYNLNQCKVNAQIENVDNRIVFLKDDAGRLSFKDKEFDCVVSNFTFHEVRSEPDKRHVVEEALRVLKKGGTFAFHDMFGIKYHYGDIYQFIEELKASGISEIHYIPDTEKKIPVNWITQAPWMIHKTGLLYGKK